MHLTKISPGSFAECSHCWEGFTEESNPAVTNTEQGCEAPLFHAECVKKWVFIQLQKNKDPVCSHSELKIISVAGVSIEALKQQHKENLERGNRLIESIESTYDNEDEIAELFASGLIYDEQHAKSVIWAARSEKSASMQRLLGTNKFLSREDRASAIWGMVFLGVKNKDSALSIVQQLLASGDIAEANRGNTVIRLAEHGYLELVQELLKNNAPIPIEHRGLGVKTVVKRRDMPLLLELLKDNARILPKHRNEAVLLTAQKWDLENSKHILTRECFHSDLEYLQVLLNGNVRIEQEPLTTAVHAAWNEAHAPWWEGYRKPPKEVVEERKTDKLNIMITLLRHGPISLTSIDPTTQTEVSNHKSIIDQAMQKYNPPAGTTVIGGDYRYLQIIEATLDNANLA